MISSGESMLDTAKELKEMEAERIIIATTFGLFTDGLAKFDDFYEKGYFDFLITTNLNYRTPELLTRPWYEEADMSKFIAAIINSLNHNVSMERALTSTDRIQAEIRKHNSESDGYQYVNSLV